LNGGVLAAGGRDAFAHLGPLSTADFDFCLTLMALETTAAQAYVGS